MKQIIITGKMAFLFILVFVVLIGSFLISAENNNKQKLSYVVDSDNNSVDSDFNGKIDFTEKTKMLNFNSIQGLSACSNGVLTGFESDSTKICTNFNDLWGQLRSGCEEKKKHFGYRGSWKKRYLTCSPGKVMVYTHSKGNSGYIVCC